MNSDKPPYQGAVLSNTQHIHATCPIFTENDNLKQTILLLQQQVLFSKQINDMLEKQVKELRVENKKLKIEARSR